LAATADQLQAAQPFLNLAPPFGDDPMKSLRLVTCVAALALLPVTGAFAQQQPAQQKQQPKEEKTFPKDSNWTLRTLNGKPVPAGLEATMRIDNQFRGAGFAGCNNWSATMWPVRGQRFAVGGVAVTKKACPAPQTKFEQEFLRALFAAPTWDIVNGLLEVKSQAGTLSFARGL
jgi:heat shock protein HslJ